MKDLQLTEYQILPPKAADESTLPVSDIGRDEVRKRKPHGLYAIVTISVAVFAIATTAADFGINFFGKGRNVLRSDLLGEMLAIRDGTEVRTTFSERVTERLLGIGDQYHRGTLGEPPVSDEHKGIGNAETGKNDIPEETESDENTENDKKNIETYPIEKTDLCGKDLGDEYISNETGYKPDIKSLIKKGNPVPKYNGDGKDPIILIIHTHGTEAYADDGKDFYTYDGGDISRTKDKEKNVVAVGKLMTEVFNENGIPTLHCEIMHDEKSYEESYSRAAETIKSYTAKYPSIQYVFDVHRDAILKSDGTLVGAVCEIDGEKVAQVMSVVGSNYKGANFPDWEDRLSLALALRASLNDKYGNISRPVYLRGAAYNEQYAKGSLLLEIGSSGNTLDEAKKAAKLVAESLTELIKGKD